MKKSTLIPVVIALLQFSGGCGPQDWCNDSLEQAGICKMEPTPYYEVGTAFNRMYRDPDQACAYVAGHASTFDATFGQCGQRIT